MLLQFSPDDIYHKYGEGWAVAYFFGICILCGFILIVIIMAISRAEHRRRKLKRAAWGKKYGLELRDTLEMGRSLFRHSETKVGEDVLKDYPYATLFQNKPLPMTMHILEGVVDGLKARVFEFRYITGSGRTTAEHRFSVVAFEFESIKPYTALRRHGWKDGLSKDDIKVGDKTFDDEFYIYADDWGLMMNELPRELAETIFNSKLIDLVLADRTLVVSAKFLRKNEAYDTFFEEVRQMAAYFKSKI